MRPTPRQPVVPGGFGSSNSGGPHHRASPDDFAGGQGYRRIVRSLKQGRDPDLDTPLGEDLLRVGAKLGTKVAQQSVGALDQDDAREARWKLGEVAPQYQLQQFGQCPGVLDSGGTSAGHDEGEPLPLVLDGSLPSS